MILAFGRYFEPAKAAGGPVVSLANLHDVVSSKQEFRIVAGDRDLGAESAFETVALNEWNYVSGRWVYYSANSYRRLFYFYALVKKIQPKVVYCNSLFDVWFTLIPILLGGAFSNAKLVLAPRGELNGAALRIKRHRKSV